MRKLKADLFETNKEGSVVARCRSLIHGRTIDLGEELDPLVEEHQWCLESKEFDVETLEDAVEITHTYA